MKKKTSRKLEFFLHILTSIVLLLKGLTEINAGLYISGSIIILFSLLVPFFIFGWKLLKIRPRQAKIACYYLESPALFATSYVLYLEGREFSPYIFALAAILYPAVGFISSRKFKNMKKAGY